MKTMKQIVICMWQSCNQESFILISITQILNMDMFLDAHFTSTKDSHNIKKSANSPVGSNIYVPNFHTYMKQTKQNKNFAM